MFKTSRLSIDEVTLADVSDFLEYMSREEYVRFLPMAIPTEETLRAHLQRRIREQDSDPRKSFFLAVRLNGSAKIIGEATIRISVLNNAEAEIGWAIHHDYTGSGFATEIGVALVSFGLKNLKLSRIFARAHPENLVSIRIMDKIGLTSDGIIHDDLIHNGVPWSSYQASMRLKA